MPVEVPLDWTPLVVAVPVPVVIPVLDEFVPLDVDTDAVPVDIDAVPLDIDAVPVDIDAVPLDIDAVPVDIDAVPVETEMGAVPVGCSMPVEDMYGVVIFDKGYIIEPVLMGILPVPPLPEAVPTETNVRELVTFKRPLCALEPEAMVKATKAVILNSMTKEMGRLNECGGVGL